MKKPNVQLLHADDLDTERWNAAVTATPNATPYGYSWWLEATTKGSWYGVVLDDYRVVMPIVCQRFGPLKVVNKAPFTQHSGPFGAYRVRDLRFLLEAIPKRWPVRKFPLYVDELPEVLGRDFKLTQRTNYELDLQPGYERLRRAYRADLKRKLRDYPPAAVWDWTPPDFLAFYRQHTGPGFGMRPAEYHRMERLLEAIVANNAGNIYCLRGAAGEPTAGLVIARKGGRIINLMASSSPAGKRGHGMARLLDGIIRHHAGQEVTLDFEGSDLPGVAMFFRSFGATKVPYLSLADQSLIPTILP